MKRLAAIAIIALSLAGGAVAEEFDWRLPPWMPKPAVPQGNPMSMAKVELGRHLFYEKRLSLDGTFSCASCHQQKLAFTDGKAQSVGVTGEAHPKSAMSLANVAYNPVLTWGNPLLKTLEDQALVPMFNEQPIEMGLAGRDLDMLDALNADPLYRELFTAAFPDLPGPATIPKVVMAIAAFERTMISVNSPYDRYRFGSDPNAISDAAKRGEALFFSEKLECHHCHGSLNLNDNVVHERTQFLEIAFHNTGLYNVGGTGNYPVGNAGVADVTGQRAHMGLFRAPTLRNVALTAPYMHDGSIATLEEVIDHYAAGGRTIATGPNAGDGSKNPFKDMFVQGFKITSSERDDLVAFLRALTDEGFVTDPRFADPFAAAKK